MKESQEAQQTPVTLDAERLEDVFAGNGASAEEIEEAMKDVSTKVKK